MGRIEKVNNDIYTPPCVKTDSWWEPVVWPRELSSGLCDDLDGSPV